MLLVCQVDALPGEVLGGPPASGRCHALRAGSVTVCRNRGPARSGTGSARSSSPARPGHLAARPAGPRSAPGARPAARAAGRAWPRPRYQPGELPYLLGRHAGPAQPRQSSQQRDITWAVAAAAAGVPFHPAEQPLALVPAQGVHAEPGRLGHLGNTQIALVVNCHRRHATHAASWSALQHKPSVISFASIGPSAFVRSHVNRLEGSMTAA